MNPAIKRLLFAGIFVIVGLTFVELMAYDVIKIEWISFMEIQDSYKPMENPLPVAARSIPVEGVAAYVSGIDPSITKNPVPADKVSVERGRLLYSVTCIQCHGADYNGNGIVGLALMNHPADLTSAVIKSKQDVDLFNTISNGIIVKDKSGKDQIHMPALNENLTFRDRWDLVNFIRSLKAAADQATPTPKP
jgi:mono/diheme cytochrome c family protein